jgi:predicted ATP-grasp superfamily ATP-dependent carboligase
MRPVGGRVVVTGGEHVGVLAAVRALRSAGYEPWAAVSRRGTYAGRSRAAAGTVEVPNPSRDGAGFVDALVAASSRLSLSAILPGTESGLIAIAERAEAFPTEVALGAPSIEIVRRATDKEGLGALAAGAGLVTPPTLTLTRGEIEASLADVPYPAVVKPLRSEVDRGDGRLRHSAPRRVANPLELRAAVDALPGDGVLVQPYLEGRLRAICGVAWNGELVCAEHQAAERIWPPECGISAYAETVPPDHELEAGVARLVASIGWSGIFQAQFLAVGDSVYLIDLNPRIYGSLALAISAGLNLPAIWVELLLGRRPTLAGYRVGTRFRAEENDARALGVALASGQWSAVRALAPRRRTAHAVFALRDPAPLLTTLGKLPRLTGRTSKPVSVRILARGYPRRLGKRS